MHSYCLPYTPTSFPGESLRPSTGDVGAFCPWSTSAPTSRGHNKVRLPFPLEASAEDGRWVADDPHKPRAPPHYMGRAALLPPTGWVIRPAVVVRTGSHTSGVASGDPGAFIPCGVRACVSSASSPTYGGGRWLLRWGGGIGCGTCLLGGAPLSRNPPSVRSFRSYPLICGIVAALCLLVSHSWGQRCDCVGIVIIDLPITKVIHGGSTWCVLA